MVRKGVAAPGLCLTAPPLASPIVADRDLLSANNRLGNRSTANPSTLTRLFCRIRDRVFAMGPATRIEMVANLFNARCGQRYADVWGDAVAYASDRQKHHRQNGWKRSITEEAGLEPARALM